MQGTTTNQFFGFRNTDSDSSIIQPNQYTSAYNVEIVGDGKFMALQNIRGTSNVQQILASSTVEELGTFATKYLVGGELHNCLTIFTAVPSGLFKIWCYDTEADVLYELFQESIAVDYLTEERIIDAVNYPENGVDVIYFTDFYNEVRFITCDLTSYSPNFLSAYDISLLRKGALGTITLTNITSGGSLLTGAYQFAYRMVNPTTKKFTKWSTLTNPIHVYDKANTTTPVYAGIGLLSDRKITLSITPSTIETDEFEFIQLAVVEDVGITIQDQNGVTSALPTTASLLEITAIPGTSLTFDYKANARIGTIPIDDIIVDLAQIETVKTLNVKENRLVAGNIKYTALEFDNGTPAITGGSILPITSGVDGFSSDLFSSKHVGYFRDEVYRLGVVYEDENGNKSTVQPLDLSSITGNAITFGLQDMKFPDRSSSASYSIWNTVGGLQSLGLRLLGLTNFPSWARSVEIVRVKRKKNILFQTPLVPMTTVQGIGAQSRYPTQYSNGNGSIIVTDAQPQTASSTLVPKNMFWPEIRAIGGNTVAAGSDTTYRAIGEAKLARDSNFTYGCLFPQPNMYGDTPFQYTGAEKVDYVDYALLKLTMGGDATTGFSSPPSTPSTVGNYYRTSVVGNFNATDESQYYYDSTTARSAISSAFKNIPISDYEYFDNLGEPASVAGLSALDFDALRTKGISFWQSPPSVQRMGVAKLGGPILPEASSIAFKAATLNAIVGGGYITNSSGPQYESANTLTNNYIQTYAGYSSGSYISALPIVNVKLGLGDDRYGDLYAQHEYISTGAKYTFSNSEIATLEAGSNFSIDIDVFGGDCFVASHTFKISDSAYSVINQSKNHAPSNPENLAVTVARWGISYVYEAPGGGVDPNICVPVAVENCGQYVQVILESEYNGGVRDIDTIGSTTAAIPISINVSKDSIRTPLTYKYNLNLSRQNFQKVFFPKVQYSFVQNDFKARIIYSDIKIYNSDQAGFDIFRVGNFYDLEENRYGITKLAIAGDNLYAIQEKGITYIPTGSRQIEQTDGGTLSVVSGEFIGRPNIIDSVRGSQHIRGIVQTGNVIYIPDNINKSVYVLSGQELKPITEDNETEFRTFFTNVLPEKNVIGIYDIIKGEYWLADNLNNKCEVFNERGGWVGVNEFTKLFGGASTNQNLYILGRPSTSLDIYTMYTGTVNTLFGLTVNPRVTFVVNPSGPISKTFDNIMIDSSDRLAEADFVVERESFLGNQVVNNLSLDELSIEGNFRFATPRDAENARLRGLRMIVTLTWDATLAALRAVGTKFRLSRRTPW